MASSAHPRRPRRRRPGSVPSPSPSTPAASPAFLPLATAAVTYFASSPPILRTPNATQLAALAYLTIAITALVFVAWYGAMERLGVDRTGLFNGLIPVTSLAAVALTGTGRCHGRPQGDRARRADCGARRRDGNRPRAGRDPARRDRQAAAVVSSADGPLLLRGTDPRRGGTTAPVAGRHASQPAGPGAGQAPPRPHSSRSGLRPPPCWPSD